MKRKIIFGLLITTIIILIAVGLYATNGIVGEVTKTTLTTSSLSSNVADGELIEGNENIQTLVSQSAMIVGINKAIEESQSAEIEDSEEDVIDEEQNVNSNSFPYYIKINYGANTVTVYGLDDAGKYTIPVKAIVCSTGSATPRSGVYKTQAKYRWKLLHGGVYGQYSTRITGSILFHSVPYGASSNNALISRYYDKLGLTASAGCVRLTTGDAKWIYDNCPIGTQVEFYYSANPGPLGKPSAIKVSDAPEHIRVWDPTDPDSRNPWPEYLKNKQEYINKEAEAAEQERKAAQIKAEEERKKAEEQSKAEEQKKLAEQKRAEEAKKAEEEKKKEEQNKQAELAVQSVKKYCTKNNIAFSEKDEQKLVEYAKNNMALKWTEADAKSYVYKYVDVTLDSDNTVVNSIDN